MSRSDSESDQQGRQHRGGVITGVHGGGVDHEHEEHGQQRLHDDTPGGGGVGANTVHAEVPCNGGKVKDGGSSDSSDGLGNDVNWKMTPCEKGKKLDLQSAGSSPTLTYTKTCAPDAIRIP